MSQNEKAAILAMLSRWEDYKTTSQAQSHVAFDQRHVKEAYGRACEAATLAVCISDLRKMVKR